MKDGRLIHHWHLLRSKWRKPQEQGAGQESTNNLVLQVLRPQLWFTLSSPGGFADTRGDAGPGPSWSTCS